jgi:hypothetical protein
MHGKIPPAPAGTIFRDDIVVIERRLARGPETVDDNSVAESDEWFADLARSVLGPSKPGTQLHFITGIDERSCQRYAAGHVKPPGYLIRALLRSEQGEQFFAALMHGSDAQWWNEHQRERRVGRAALAAFDQP